MTTKKNNKLVSWDNHLDKKYGKKGTATRKKYEEEFEAFKNRCAHSGSQEEPTANARTTSIENRDNKKLYFEN